MKKVFFILIILLFPIMVYSLDGYVFDDASLLSDDTIYYISQHSEYLKNKVDASIYIMTIQKLEEYDLDSYAEAVFDDYDIGSYEILILFENDKKTLKILAGEELSYYLTPDYLNEIIDLYFAPFIKNHEYDKGLKNGYSALYIDLCNYYGIDASEVQLLDGNDFITKYKAIVLIAALSIALLITYFFCIFFRSYYRTRKHSLTDYFMFGIVLFVNLVLVSFAYSLEPASVVVYAAVVLYVVMRIFGEGNSVSIQEALFRAREKEREKAREKRRKKRK